MESAVEMSRYGMAINISRCTGCYNCFAACKDEYWGNDYLPYSAAQPKFDHFWMNILKNERGVHPYTKVAYMPLLCMHCAEAPCVKAARDQAVYKRPDGIVIIDPQRAIGQKQLLSRKACPYGVIYWNEEKQLPQKCTFCTHRIENGKTPRCVQACPSGALIFGDLDDPGSEVSKLLKSSNAAVSHPEWKTGPAIFYSDLHKMTQYFVAGAVVFGDTDECARGVTITLNSAGIAAETTSNSYGNFEFDGLDSGKYLLKLEYPGYAARTIRVNLKNDKCFPAIILTRTPPSPC
jgi:Fe-S-cluster-containing dehydrogenase component